MHGINLFEYGFDADSILLAGQLRGSDEAGCPKSGQGLIGPVKLVSSLCDRASNPARTANRAQSPQRL